MGLNKPRKVNNTDDATAVASDILANKTAYARGVKLIGSYTPLDTADATADSTDIAIGKTAYVNGVKVTGETPVVTGTATTSLFDTEENVNHGLDLSFGADMLIREGGKARVTNNALTSALGITAEKIVSGNTIAGVVGSHVCPTGAAWKELTYETPSGHTSGYTVSSTDRYNTCVVFLGWDYNGETHQVILLRFFDYDTDELSYYCLYKTLGDMGFMSLEVNDTQGSMAYVTPFVDSISYNHDNYRITSMQLASATNKIAKYIPITLPTA